MKSRSNRDKTVTSLQETLWRALDYHCKEFDINIAEAVGVLEIVKNEVLLRVARNQQPRKR